MISEYLTEGGMGAIYLGKRVGIGGFERHVVLKQLLPEFVSDAHIRELFLREACLSATLEHQNIVRTLDVLEVSGSYYIVMEYVRGADLRSLLRRARRRGRRFAPAAALLIAGEILEALDYAHNKTQPNGRSLNLIHRDISTSNILLSATAEVKLSDFGIAKAATHNSVKYHVRGKVGYMSPEQARGDPLDARSDLFSLAVVLYEILCDQRLFIGDLTQSPAVIYGAPVVPPSRRVPGLHKDFDRLMERALQLVPEKRFQSALEFHHALRDTSRRHGMHMDHLELAAHLKEVCGPTPEAWLRDEDRTGTARISASEIDESGLIADEDLIEEDAAPGEAPEAAPGAAGQEQARWGHEAEERTPLTQMERVQIEEGPPGRADTTRPMQTRAPHFGIAAMARQMVAASPAPSGNRPGADGSGTSKRGPTLRVLARLEQETDAIMGPWREARMGRGRMIILITIVLTLLGLGALLGLLLSHSPLPEEPPSGGTAARASRALQSWQFSRPLPWTILRKGSLHPMKTATDDRT